jgi:hypothetical protein
VAIIPLSIAAQPGSFPNRLIAGGTLTAFD